MTHIAASTGAFAHFPACWLGLRPGQRFSAESPSPWAVVATDYTGMGAEGDMPYLVGQGEARSVLDGVQATHQLPAVTLSEETVIWGHSQGGHAALWTAQIAPAYAPEVDVVGTAALSPASDVVALAEDVSSKGPLAGVVLSFMLSAYDSAYDDVDLADNVPTAARTLVREIATSAPRLRPPVHAPTPSCPSSA